MSVEIPVLSDDMTLLDRHNKILSEIQQDLGNTDWSKELDRMHRDMLTLRPVSTGILRSASPNPTGGEKFISKDIHGRPVFTTRFDVRQFEPQEIEVRLVDNKLQVHAKHEKKDGESSEMVEYSRRVALPLNIDLKSLNCVVSSDGYLTAEALLPPPKYTSHLSPGGSSHSSPLGGSSHSSPLSLRAIPLSFHSIRTSPMLARKKEEDGHDKFCVEVDVSRFEPNSVKITTDDRMLRVKAKGVENVTGGTTSKELNKEIQLPKSCNPDKIKAFFSAGGKLILKEV